MMLIIAEELLIVGRDQDGKELSGRVERTRGVAGALLIDLTLNGLLGVVDRRLVVPAAKSMVGHPELQGLLDRVRSERRPHKPKWWVQKAESGEVNQRLLAGLAEQGILAERHDRVLGLFPTTRWAERGPQPREDILRRLTAAVEGGSADDRTCALASLVDACGMSGKLFPDISRSVRKARMKELSQGDWAADAVRDAIRSVHAATTAAITASSAAATS